MKPPVGKRFFKQVISKENKVSTNDFLMHKQKFNIYKYHLLLKYINI